MPVISTPQEFNVDDLYVDLRRLTGHPLYLKCEGFNFAGSIKLKAANEMVSAAVRSGALHAGTTLVESSSGNLGVALALVAASRGLRFLCVTDTRCNLSTRQLMTALGAEVHVITEPDPLDGFLGARIRFVQQVVADNPDHLWLNQYANPGNSAAHYQTTGPEILKSFPDVDVVFIGAGSTGTLMGCARYFRDHKPTVRVVAVDSIGSVTFGTPAQPRMLPGLGTSVRPPLLDESYVDEVLHVAEADTVRWCRALLRQGFLFGGSTGTVLSGAAEWLARQDGDLTAVAIAPDLGERYLDTVYHDQWIADIYGADLLGEQAPATLARRMP
ncbi:2,3-diaminopropionate biosynthesis protein SbnA [Actinosynnema sp. NPDC047251]|uniref:Cysteine synthase n=1 Tax=Saccharothrix espanaensis (strain ATCC 51144 / DSM 44229 / JCM 9112 / NBRC 15066 / NRRL 15764) TaxID=1179773 RepID=K0JSA4_SACES|nr:2,3-diaminopropionate biosynthesis protein SbnA [Saccharothrix espanaensis]CCH30550.1 Cysteine synthase [Saccharothrix espanaensis DSM 44229]